MKLSRMPLEREEVTLWLESYSDGSFLAGLSTSGRISTHEEVPICRLEHPKRKSVTVL